MNAPCRGHQSATSEYAAVRPFACQTTQEGGDAVCSRGVPIVFGGTDGHRTAAATARWSLNFESCGGCLNVTYSAHLRSATFRGDEPTAHRKRCQYTRSVGRSISSVGHLYIFLLVRCDATCGLRYSRHIKFSWVSMYVIYLRV